MRVHVALGLLLGCSPPSDDPRDATVADARDAGKSESAPYDWYVPPADANPCNFLPPPNPDVPPGWVLHTDYCGHCGFYVPTKQADLPPPIQWEPCSNKLPLPMGATCQQMKRDWLPNGEVGPHIRAWQKPAGPLFLQFPRFAKGGAYRLVAEADGPTHQAIFESGNCYAADHAINSDMATYGVYEFDSQGKTALGVMGGDINSLSPRGYLRYEVKPKEISSNVFAGATTFLHWRYGLDLYRFSDGGLVAPVVGTGLGMRDFFFHGDVLFWQSFSAATSGYQFRLPDGTVKDLLWFGSDFTRAVLDLNTDGADYVWIEGYGRASPNDLFPSGRIMTAKYTEDPATLAPRRLRSENPAGAASAQTKVGCGYSLGRAVQGMTDVGLRITRLSDGRSWLLIAPAGPIGLDAAVAITCTEAFIRVTDPANNIIRVRLDSLGPGVPAD